MGLTELAQYGLAGIAVGNIIALIVIVKWITDKYAEEKAELTRIIGNHVQHSTEAEKGLTVVIRELITWLKTNNRRK